MTRLSPVWMVSLPERKALSEPDTASTTALLEFSQVLSADWMREVSSLVGGLAISTCDEVNCAESVSQAVGVVGWVTVRVSPVAKVCAAAVEARRNAVRQMLRLHLDDIRFLS